MRKALLLRSSCRGQCFARWLRCSVWIWTPRPKPTCARPGAIWRPGALTPSVVLSLGLGLTLLVTLALIDGNLRREITGNLPRLSVARPLKDPLPVRLRAVGAVLIVLANAMLLHSRWAGLVRECGIACLAIFGGIVTSWSWFGTNMLGVGLHSYGFMDSAAWWLIAFVVSQFLLIAVANVPLHLWRSVAAGVLTKPAPRRTSPSMAPSPT